MHASFSQFKQEENGDLIERVDTKIDTYRYKDLHLYLNRCSLWICGMKDVHLN